MKKTIKNERTAEYAFVFDCLRTVQPHTVLDIGSGKTALPALMQTCVHKVLAMDMKSQNPHFDVVADDITNPKQPWPLVDMITCVSVLEQIPDYNKAVANMVALLRPGGHLLITCPYKASEFVRNAYEKTGHKAPYICAQYSDREMNHWKETHGLSVVNAQLFQHWTGRYWTDGVRIAPIEVDFFNPHHLGCFLLRKND